MKNIFTLFCAACIAMLFVGCGKKPAANEKANADAAWDQQWGENPETFSTPDLNWMSARGHVRRIVMNGRTIFELDRKGNLTYLKMHGLTLDNITRNQDGQIIKLTNLETAPTEEIVIFEYDYDERGYLEYEARFMPDGSHYHHYNLDRLGNVKSGNFDYQRGKTEIHALEMYRYPKIDSHGNWVQLVITKNSDIEPEMTINRTIEYYE